MKLIEKIKKTWENDFRHNLLDYESCLESDLYMAQYNGEWDKIPLVEKELRNVRRWKRNPLQIPFAIGATNHTVLHKEDPLKWLYKELGEEKEELLLMILLTGGENFFEFISILNYIMGKQEKIEYLLPTDFRDDIKEKFLKNGKIIKKRKSFIKISIKGDEAVKILKEIYNY